MDAPADAGARLAALTRDVFAPCVGQAFLLSTEGGPVTLSLLRADALGAHASLPGRRQPFSLVFVGPGQPVLAQHIYRIEHATLGALEIFLVPIGRDEGGVRYESIFC
jgi:hypothetical protein